MTTHTVSPTGGLAELLFACAKTYAVKAILDLSIPDILAKAGGQLTLDEIASKLPSKTVKLDYLARIMTYAALNNLFTELSDSSVGIVDDGQRRFGLTELSSSLVEEERDNPESSFAHMARFQLTRIAMEPWNHLSGSVLTGTEPFELAHGKGLWEVAKADQEWGRFLNKGMAANSFQTMSSVLKTYKGFKGLKQLVDVGGGLGSSLTVITQAYPDIQGVNFDLPFVVSEAPDIPGVKHVGGDMFKSVPEGDAIFMKLILHDWGDEECIHILQNCYKSLPRDGKVIIVDLVLADPKNASPQEYTMDLLMMAHASGRERTAPQWHRILKAAGFQRVEIIPCPPIFVIEGHT